MQKELTEKEKEIGKYKSYKTDDERIKDLTNLYSQYAEENKQLKQQLEEKDKEIEHLKDAVNMCQSIKRYDIGEMLTENIKLKQNQTQLAIQELEKVKEWLEPKYFDYEQINYLTRIIDNQIKELKGEK